MFKKSLLFIALATSSLTLFAQEKLTTQQYIEKYKDYAIKTMVEYKVPASVTMAQAIVESVSGNSHLSQISNNHFGIKCKTEWTGESVKYSDDLPDECFRKYSSVLDSYIDHAEFLAFRDRYKSLFSLEITDYKGWCEGLKAAGYATNPKYAPMLIKVVEDNALYALDDKAVEIMTAESVEKPAEEVKEEVVVAKPAYKEEVELDENGYYAPTVLAGDYVVYSNKGDVVYKNNDIKFVIAREGDTFEKISERVGKSVSRLVKYNDFEEQPTVVGEGVIVYIESKGRKAKSGYITHVVAKGETLHQVSQKYGIRMDKLADINLYDRYYTIKVGQRMLLR